MKLKNTIQNNEGTIIDVRTPAEFMGGMLLVQSIYRCMKSPLGWKNLKR